jgi:hypothetical protein
MSLSLCWLSPASREERAMLRCWWLAKEKEKEEEASSTWALPLSSSLSSEEEREEERVLVMVVVAFGEESPMAWLDYSQSWC